MDQVDATCPLRRSHSLPTTTQTVNNHNNYTINILFGWDCSRNSTSGQPPAGLSAVPVETDLDPESDQEAQPPAGQSAVPEDPDSDPESDQEGQPPLPEIRLESKFTSRHDLRGSIVCLVRLLLTIFTTAFTIYYGWNGLFPYFPSPRFLWDKPNNSLFVINVLAFISTLLVHDLVGLTYDRFRWTKASHSSGIIALDFLACSPSTPIGGLLRFAFFWFPSFRKSRSHRWLAFQRLCLLAIQAITTVILLLNIVINTVYFPIPNTTTSGKGGVVPLDQDLYYQWLSRDQLQSQAFTQFKSAHQGYFITAQITTAPGFPSLDRCEAGSCGCIRHYLTQVPIIGVTQEGIGTSDRTQIIQNSSYITFWNSPIYDITFSMVRPPYFWHLIGGIYGYEGNALALQVLRDSQADPTNSSIYIGCQVCGPSIQQSPNCPVDNYDSINQFQKTLRFGNSFDPAYLKLDIVKRTADLTYYLLNYSVVAIDNVSQEGQIQNINDTNYISFFSSILPWWSPASGNPSPGGLEALLFEISQSACNIQAQYRGAPGGAWNIPYVELLTLPFIIQQHNIERMSLASLPPENNVTSTYVRVGTKISLDPTSFWCFSVLTIFSIVWCAGLIARSIFIPTPVLAGISEVDMVVKLGGKLGILENLGDSPRQKDILKVVGETKLWIHEPPDTSTVIKMHRMKWRR